MLVRALIYRLITESCLRGDAGLLAAVRAANEPVVHLVLARLAGRPPAAHGSEERLAALAAARLGEPVELLPLPPASEGHTRDIRRLERLVGTTVFVKAAAPGGAAELQGELDAYEAPAPFLPVVRDPLPVLILEALPHGGPRRSAGSVGRGPCGRGTRRPAPPGASRGRGREPLGGHRSGRAAPAAAAGLRRGVAGRPPPGPAVGGGRRGPGRGPAPASGRAHGQPLLPRRGLVLVDWAAAGTPWFDHHNWLVTMHADGGPDPEVDQGADAAGHAAWIAR